jgi:hypothetical protein
VHEVEGGELTTKFSRLAQWLALALVLAAFACAIVMFVGIILLMTEVGSDVPFEVAVQRVKETRAWGFVGGGLFAVGCLSLWFRPGERRQDDE